MNITFDKGAKQFVWNIVKRRIDNRTCPFCGVPITAKNFAGAIWIGEEFRAFNNSIICLIALADNIKKPQKKNPWWHIHWFKPVGDWTGYYGIKKCRCGETRTYEIV